MINRNTVQNLTYALEEVGASQEVLKAVTDYAIGPENIMELVTAIHGYMSSIVYARAAEDVKKSEESKRKREDIFRLN